MVSVMNGNDFTCKPDAIEAVAVNCSENTTLSEDTRVSGANSVNVVGSEEVRVSVGGVRSMENGRCEETRVGEEMKDGDGYMVSGTKSIEVEMCTVNGDRFSARDGETEQWNGRGRVSESGVGKGHIEVGKPCVSEYDAMISMFDEYAASDKGKAVGSARDSGSVGYGYEIGDMVWGKVKSHPWWPGHVYNEAFATPAVRRTKRVGHVLVAFFGDSSYGWFELNELLPFDSNYTEKSRQTNMRTFVYAVEEAVDEASRRCALALACRCRNPYNFRPAEDQGYFAVDLGDNEPAGVYSMTQIRKSRESFQPRDVVAFAKQLALTPGGDGHGSIEFIKNKATIMAYRKAVFEEFDETYAQAFGTQPKRPSREPMQAVTQTARAPLSGPLKFAEALGKKNSRKQNKAKGELDTDRYLFKRRDEPNEFKVRQKGQKTTSLRPSLVEGSPELTSGDYVLQKRASTLSPKQQIPAKVEQMFSTEINSPSATSRVTSMEDEPVAPRFNVPGLLVSGSKVEQCPDVGDNYPVRPNLDHMSPLLEPNTSKSVDGFQRPPNLAAKVERTNGIGVKFQGQDSRLRMETGVKKTKLVKCPAGESVTEKSSLGVKKKKREKELVMEMRRQKKAFTGNAGPPPREDIRLEHQKKDNGGSSLVRDSLGSLPATIGLGKLELKLPQLLDGLHALALNPFCGMESNNSAIIRRAFLNFRSLVYQKSLPMSSTSEMQSHEVPPPDNAKDLPSAKLQKSPPPDNAKDLPSAKLQKSLTRPSDPTKGGRKRVPSDRLDELSAKRVKKINDIKSLAVEKKVAERNLESQRDAKETMDSRRAKWFKPDPVKRKGPLAKVREPTILVIKFPPNTTLPARFELKARLARFGPMDDSRTRILWKSSQVHVVFFHRADAEAAERHLMGSNTLFSKVNMRCSLRPLEATAPESETKVQREDGSVENPHLRDSRLEQRPASATQLKSCLKKQVVDEAAALAESGRGTSRVKFVLGVAEGGGRGEEIISSNNHFSSNEVAAMSATGGGRLFPRVNFMSGGGENLMDASKNILNTASLAGGASSISHGMDFSSKNFQKGNLPPLLPLPPQFQNASTNLRYLETTHRTTHSFDARLSSNFDEATTHRTTHIFDARLSSNFDEATLRTTHDYDTVLRSNSIDIAPEMLGLLAKCYDVVTNLVCNLGYLPYHPL